MEIEIRPCGSNWVVLKLVGLTHPACSYRVGGFGFVFKNDVDDAVFMPKGLDELGVYAFFTWWLRENGYTKGATDEHSTDDPA